MTIPVEIIALCLSANAAFLSIAIHLLIRIYGNIKDVATEARVYRAKCDEDLASLRRHDQRNQKELDLLRGHVFHSSQHNPKGIAL